MKEQVEMMSREEMEVKICAAVKESQNWGGEHQEIKIGGRYSITVRYVDSGEDGRWILCEIGQYDIDGVWACITCNGENLTYRDEDPTEEQIEEAAERAAADIERSLS